MMKTLVGLAALATLGATATTAAAESYDATQPAKPARGYVGVGMMFGTQRAFASGMFIDGGKRIAGSPVFAHGQLTGGASGTDGSFAQMRLGAEARGCVAHQLVCGFAGADIGYQHDHVIDEGSADEVVAHDLLLVPRVGAEVGTKIRLRALAELPTFQQLNGSVDQMTYASRGTGLALSLAVAGVF